MPKNTSIIEPFSIGIASLVCGIASVSAMSQNLILACLGGIAGISIGILALKAEDKKFDKYCAWMGIALSFVPFIYALILLILK